MKPEMGRRFWGGHHELGMQVGMLWHLAGKKGTGSTNDQPIDRASEDSLSIPPVSVFITAVIVVVSTYHMPFDRICSESDKILPAVTLNPELQVQLVQL